MTSLYLYQTVADLSFIHEQLNPAAYQQGADGKRLDRNQFQLLHYV